MLAEKDNRMAILQFNPLVKSVKGSFGNAMFRRVGNRIIFSGKPSSPQKQSEAQRENRRRFKMATAYAKQILQDPQKKAYYQQKAKKLKLYSAYVAAITDYMRKGEIKEITTHSSKDKPGQGIRIRVNKNDFAINTVRVVVYDAQGKVVSSGLAVKKDNKEFIYYRPDVVLLASMKVEAVIADHNWDKATRVLVI